MTKAEFQLRYPCWTLEWGYGSWIAVHDNFDASYEGPEDGWVSNGLQCYSNGDDFDSLAEEIDALIEDKPTYFSEQEVADAIARNKVQDRERN